MSLGCKQDPGLCMPSCLPTGRKAKRLAMPVSVIACPPLAVLSHRCMLGGQGGKSAQDPCDTHKDMRLVIYIQSTAFHGCRCGT